MTYKEFEKWCKENGYNASDRGDAVYVITGLVVSRLGLGSVSKERSNSMLATSYEQVADDLFAKMVELASTPIEEREEPKRYIVRIPSENPEGFYALKKDGGNMYMYNDSDPDLDDEYKLTEGEIKAIDERFMPFAVEVEE